MHFLGNCYLGHSLQPNLIKIITLNANPQEIITLNAVYNLIKIITLNANTQKIVTLQTVCSLI